MDETAISKILKTWASPDESFREGLLQSCLDVLSQDDGRELDDENLEMLAAAGDFELMASDDDEGICSRDTQS